MKTRNMCRTALMTALLCVVGPITVPVGPVPLSLTTLAVYLSGALLGAKRGVQAVAAYLLIGAMGMPVFAGFSAGVHRIVGVTGGYMLGYLVCAAVVGLASGRRRGLLPAMIIGTAFCYGLGTAWFMVLTGNGLVGALSACVIPFLPGDAVKIAVAAAAAKVMQKGLSFL